MSDRFSRPPAAAGDCGAQQLTGNMLVLAMLLFDRDPGALAFQVRAWLEEGRDV